MNIDYKTTAYATGGRDGHVRLDDSPIDFEMALPADLGGKKTEGANSEQLFTAGFAACFGSALQHAIRVRRLKLPAPDPP